MRIRLPRLLGGFRGRSSSSDVNNTPNVTDGLQSYCDEEPENVALTFEENLEQRRLNEASKLLIAREEHLFREIPEADAPKHRQEEVDKLDADYSKLSELVQEILGKSMSVGLEEVTTETLSSAVEVICQEEEQYQLWKRATQTPPTWRKVSWKVLHDTTLHNLVQQSLEAATKPPPDAQESLHMDVNLTGKQLQDDLLRVVNVLSPCYPPHMDICNLYARMYHQVFGNRLKKISEFVLVDKDIKFLLRWVNEFYPGILQKPELAKEIDTEALGKLLSQKDLDPLEEEFLSQQQSELMTYIDCILDQAEERWNKAEEPKREDGCYVSPVAYDIIQFINGMVSSAETVVGDQHKAQRITCQLNAPMERFKSFQSDIIKKNKAHSTAYVKAYLGCTEQFRDVLLNKDHLFAKDARENCLQVLADMKQSAHTYLLSPVHDALKAQYRKLGTNDWLNKSVFQDLMVDIETKIEGLQGLTKSCHQDLISQLYQDVTIEYVKRLLKGEIKLKDRERQDQAYTVVKANADSLYHLFSRKGSDDEWLKEILTKIAEVLKLQDLPAIQMQVASLGSSFPDLSEKQVSALLKLKTNLSKADRKTVKETLSDILKETSNDGARPFFSKVQVR